MVMRGMSHCIRELTCCPGGECTRVASSLVDAGDRGPRAMLSESWKSGQSHTFFSIWHAFHVSCTHWQRLSTSDTCKIRYSFHTSLLVRQQQDLHACSSTPEEQQVGKSILGCLFSQKTSNSLWSLGMITQNWMLCAKEVGYCRHVNLAHRKTSASM